MISSITNIQGLGKRCLVLGGLGFIGTHLVKALLDLGFKVRCFERPHTNAVMADFFQHPNFELFEGDFASETDVAEAIKNCDFCYHLVSTTLPKSSNLDPVFDIESNLIGTIRLLQHAVDNGVQKVIFISSGGTVYGTPMELPILENHPTDPTCSYGITKLAIEKYFALFHHLHGLDYTVLRLANPYGEGQRIHSQQGAIAVFLGKILRGETIEIWGDGTVVRDYIHVSDVVDSLLLSLAASNGSHLFNIGSGTGNSLNEIISTIESVTNCRAIVNYSDSRAFDIPVNILNINKAKNLSGWSPKVNLETGIERFYKWLNVEGTLSDR
ncbi:TPA: NAD-dependent epimerase/dehydratase family protein [Aeromonas sobria]|jgi:UDP-glucose 4-epimerase|nr:NAD-dependent epimerase/dehydratase family protein [Aeromonas sobria]